MPPDSVATTILGTAHSSVFAWLLLAFLVISGLEIMTKKLQGLISELTELASRFRLFVYEVRKSREDDP